MIVIHAEMKAKPGQAEVLERLLLELFPNVQKEEGVVNYILHRHATEKERFFFYERYASRAVMDAHMKTPYLHDVLEAAGPLLAAPPVVEVYEDQAEVKPPAQPAGMVKAAHNGSTVWVRADLQGRQKEHCICWSCRKFQPDTADKGCPIICSVLQLAVQKGVILPVWACPVFDEKA